MRQDSLNDHDYCNWAAIEDPFSLTQRRRSQIFSWRLAGGANTKWRRLKNIVFTFLIFYSLSSSFSFWAAHPLLPLTPALLLCSPDPPSPPPHHISLWCGVQIWVRGRNRGRETGRGREGRGKGREGKRERERGRRRGREGSEGWREEGERKGGLGRREGVRCRWRERESERNRRGGEKRGRGRGRQGGRGRERRKMEREK